MSGMNEGELLRGGSFVEESSDIWCVDRRHEDGERWVEVQRHPSREAAEEGLQRLVQAGMARDDVRVRRVDPDAVDPSGD
jgi:hypothetical protein